MMKNIIKKFVMAGCLMAALMLTACGGGSKEIDLNDYLEISVKGTNGDGSAHYLVDKKALLNDYGDKIDYSNSLKNKAAKITDQEIAEYLLSWGFQSFKTDDMEEMLSVLIALSDCDSEKVAEELNTILKGKYYTADSFDTIVKARFTRDITPADELMELLPGGAFNEKGGLSNGDNITFTWSFSEDDNKTIKQFFNYDFKCSDVKYTVEGLDDNK